MEIWNCMQSVFIPLPWLPTNAITTEVKVTAAVVSQLAWRSAQSGNLSTFILIPEGQSSAGLHMATVLFTSLRKPITLLLRWARQSCYISSTDMHFHMCAEPLTHAHTHTHTHTQTHTHWRNLPQAVTHKGKDKHLQQLFLLQWSRYTGSDFWPVCG